MEKNGIKYLNCNKYRGGAVNYNPYNFAVNNQRPSPRINQERYNKPPAPVVHKKLIKRRIPVVYQKIIDKSLKIGIAVYIYGIVAFAGLLLLVTLNAACERKKSSVLNLQNEIKALREANTAERAALAAQYDENEIEALAREMGMRKPKPYQIEYINVPKESYAMGGGAETADIAAELTLLDKLIGWLGIDLQVSLLWT